MKTLINAIVVIAVAACLTVPYRLHAQVVKGDTMFVYPNPPGNLDNVIFGDTTATGARTDYNRVYVLFGGTSDTSIYYFDRGLYPLTYNLTLIGRPDPATGMLPVIAPIYNVSGSIPTYFNHQNGRGLRTTYKNLFFLMRTPDGLTKCNSIYSWAADSCTFIMDHCVVSDQWTAATAIIALYNGLYGKATITNCEFRNVGRQDITGGGQMVAPGNNEDSLIVVNNTWYGLTKNAVSSNAYNKYFLLDHNTFFCDVDPALEMIQAQNAVITNNIFYSTFAAGADSSYMNAGSYGVKGRRPAVIILDSLRLLTQPPYNLTEAARHVTVANNVYSWAPKLYAAWKAMSDTAVYDKGLLTSPVWMDNFTANMFNDKTNWPGLYMADNDSVDPGFNSPTVSTVVDSMVNWINTYWVKRTCPYFYSADTLNPVTMFSKIPANWSSHSIYPVPENLRYTDAALYYAGTDGKALGDLNWFPEQLNSNPPPAPTIVALKGATGIPRKATLKWNKSAGATGYHVQVSTNATFSTTAADTAVSDTTVKLGTPLAAITKYYWHVAATNTTYPSGTYSAVDSFTTGTGIDAVTEENGLPKTFALFQNYPNPFNPTTLIRYDVPKTSQVTIKVYDVLGREVTTLVDTKQAPGEYTIEFNGSKFASGVYLFRMDAGNYTKIQKMMLVK